MKKKIRPLTSESDELTSPMSDVSSAQEKDLGLKEYLLISSATGSSMTE